MQYNEMKNIVETIDELKNLSFDTLDDAKEWAKMNCQNTMHTDEPDYFDFDYKMLTGTFYQREDGQIELCENMTAYDENGEPKMDIEL